MADNYSGLETKENSLEQVLKLAGLPSKFKLRAEEFNTVRAKLNDLKFLIDSLVVNSGGISGIRVVEYPFTSLSEITSFASYINNLNALTVEPGRIVKFKFTLIDLNNNTTTTKVFSIRGQQEGIYGVGGSRILQENDMLLDFERITTAQELEQAQGTQVVTFPNLSGNIEDWLTAQNPAITLQIQSAGLVIFRGTILNEPTSYLFVGPRGNYGVGAQEALAEHFEPLKETSDGITVDSAFSNVSLNPLQNKIITDWKKIVDEKLQDLSVSITGIRGTNYLFVQANGTDAQNAAELQAAYDLAKTMTPSATNKIDIICGGGLYDFSADFLVDTPYINIVSLDGNKSIIFNGVGTIDVDTDYAYIKGIDVLAKPFKVRNFISGDPALNTYNTIIENCKGGNESFTRFPSPSSTCTYIDCIGDANSFRTAYGSLIRCELTSGNFQVQLADLINCTNRDTNGIKNKVFVYQQNTIEFKDIPGAQYGTATSPRTGDLLNSNIKAKLGQVQKIYHDGPVEPGYATTWKKSGTGTYLVNASAESKVNVIFAEWESSTRQVYWIIQETL